MFKVADLVSLKHPKMHTNLIEDFKKSQRFTEGQIQEKNGVVHCLQHYSLIGLTYLP